ncbi:GNAT family N-acetyltransferase [Vibrio tubiashii]|uniref:GNAT family N-acetyltransferase n=1 Tax=Vibrio tubiashii TaxID=29498 RepID=UPI001EFCF330|nr:GNAT family N-acetyltransferase [Vibrio tubiashii]MCG9579698.1 GNAT family N-acetyltransferase [Vibrio tubiashii]
MKLVTPRVEYQESYIEMVREFSEREEAFIPFVLAENYEDFSMLLDRLSAYSRGEEVPGFVAHSSFWLIDENDQVVGCSNLRHELNDGLLVLGGHIGYGIKPSERKKGYAKRILELTLPKAKSIGIDKALVTVSKANLGSVKAIKYNKAVLEAEKQVPGQKGIVQYYWLNTCA